MKIIIFTILFSAWINAAFTQNTAPKKPSSQNTININLPNFADPATKQFYEAYTYYIKKAVIAIRNKDEAAWKNLLKEEKQVDEKREQMMKTKPTPDDIKKKHEWNKQALPYMQDINQSEFNKT